MSVLFRLFPSLLSVLMATFLTEPARALDKYDVLPGAFAKIDEHDVCRIVGNTNANKIMIPTKSAAEWAIGPKAFLRNIAPKISVDTCVPIVLKGSLWGRPGPMASTGFPLKVPGSGGPVTLLTVGTPVGGGTATLVGNEIHYDPGSTFYNLFYLETKTVTIPWTGLDKYDLPVSGTATLTVKGFWEGLGKYVIAMPESSTSGIEVVEHTGSVSFDYAPGMNVVRFRSGTFDGDFSFDTLSSVGYPTTWAIIIDNSIAARSAYTLGASAGNPNGDGYSNTMLDAQIKAAVNFIEAISNALAIESAGKKIGVNDGDYWLTVASTGGNTVNVYTMNSGLQLVGYSDFSTTADRDALLSKVRAIRHSTSANAKVYTALESLRTGQASTLFGTFASFVNVIVLSPGVSDGVSFSTPFTTLDGTGTGQWGMQFFAYRSGASNAVINALDSTGVAVPITSESAISNSNIPHPIFLEGFYLGTRNASTDPWNYLKNSDGTNRMFSFTEMYESPIGSFVTARVVTTERPVFECRTVNCGATELTPYVYTNEKRFNALDGQYNGFRTSFVLKMRPGYVMKNDTYASDFNIYGDLHVSVFFSVYGWYTPNVP